MFNFNNVNSWMDKFSKWLEQAKREGQHQEKLEELVAKLEILSKTPELKDQKNQIVSLIQKVRENTSDTESNAKVGEIRKIFKAKLDKTNKPEKRIFSSSLPALNLAKVRGHFWEPFKMKRDPASASCGMLLSFQLKDKWNPLIHPNCDKNYVELHKKIFPAIEAFPIDLIYLVPDLNEDECEKILENFQDLISDRYPGLDDDDDFLTEVEMVNHEIVGDMLNELGYSFSAKEGSFILTLPDLNLLLERWKKLQVTRPNLLDLNIKYGSEQAESDLDFIKAFIVEPGAVECILSTGKEFVHDQLVHVLSLLKRLIIIEKKCVNEKCVKGIEITTKNDENPMDAYRNRLSEFREALLEKYNLILKASELPNKTEKIVKDIEIATFSMGVLIDTVTAAADVDIYNEKLSLSDLTEVKEGMSEYYEKRFGSDWRDSVKLKEVWDELREFTEQNVD